MDSLCKVISQYGITSQEACESITHLPQIPFSEMDIALIRSNPGLSWFQKRKLIKEIRKEITID